MRGDDDASSHDQQEVILAAGVADDDRNVDLQPVPDDDADQRGHI